MLRPATFYFPLAGAQKHIVGVALDLTGGWLVQLFHYITAAHRSPLCCISYYIPPRAWHLCASPVECRPGRGGGGGRVAVPSMSVVFTHILTSLIFLPPLSCLKPELWRREGEHSHATLPSCYKFYTLPGILFCLLFFLYNFGSHQTRTLLVLKKLYRAQA